MGARTKLNIAYFNGALGLAALVGLFLQSWWAFWIVLILCLSQSAAAGEIRPKR